MLSAGRTLTTSPYLLWRQTADGVGEVVPLSGANSLTATDNALGLLNLFAVGRRPEARRIDLLRLDPTGEVFRHARKHGFLVRDLEQHREEVFNAFERRFHEGPPQLGYIETTNRCPFACIMCPKTSPAYDRPDHVMPMALFERIVRQLKHQASVCLHLFGDPLMDPHLFDRLTILRRANLRSSFSTNAVMLTRTLRAKLISSGPDRLIVSCDAVTDETYRAVRGKRARQKLSDQRVGALLKAWEASDRPFDIVLRFIELDVNFSEREDFLERWSGVEGVEVDFKAHLRFPDVPALLDREARRPSPQRFLVQVLGRRAPVKCLRHWCSHEPELAVQTDGSVVPCCLAHNREVVLGDLGRQTLTEIWHGNRFADLRRALFFREGLEAFPICQRCNNDLA